jgi:hypothetical protein
MPTQDPTEVVNLPDAGAKAAPSKPEGKPTAAGRGALEGQELQKTRRKRIRDYRMASLQNPLPEVAILGNVTADFAELEFQLAQKVDEIRKSFPTPRPYLEKAHGGIEVMLKLARQMERCMRLAQDLAAVQTTPPCEQGGPGLNRSHPGEKTGV